MIDRIREMAQEAAWYVERIEKTDTTREQIQIFLWGPTQPDIEDLENMVDSCMGFIDCDRVEDKYDGGMLEPSLSYRGYWTVVGEKNEQSSEK